MIEVNFSGLENIHWIVNNHSNVAANALNIVLRSERTFAGEKVIESYNVGINTVKSNSNLTVYPANKLTLMGRLIATGKRLGLIKFQPHQESSGSSIMIKKTGGRKIILHSFIQTMPSGHKGIFIRKGEKRIMTKGRYASKLRQPISELFTLSIGEMMSALNIWSAMIDYANEHIAIEMDKEYQKFLNGIGRYTNY